MSFINNATKFYLLTNKPIIFSNEEEEQSFEFFPPSLETLMTNENLASLINFLEQDLDDLAKTINKEVKSHYSYLHLVFSLAEKIEVFKNMSKSILKGFQVLIHNFDFRNSFVIDDIFVDRKLFEDIIEVLFLTIEKEIIIIKEEEDEFTKAEKKAKLRAQKIKNNSKTNKKGTKIESMIIGVIHEFPQYKIKDILEMNLYTFYYLFSYIGKISNYEIGQIAVGNGLLKSKKHKHYIE